MTHYRPNEVMSTLNHLDGTMLLGTNSSSQDDSHSTARRSLSIFSRRGTETPEPKTIFFSTASMASASFKSSNGRRYTTEQRSSIQHKKSKGTILNAVPQARAFFSTKSRDQTLSPKHLTTVKESSPLEFACVTASQQAAERTPPNVPKLKQPASLSLSPRSWHHRKTETEARIGVWVNGVAHWDDAVKVGLSAETIESQTGFTPLRPQTLHPNQKKPILTVVIPPPDIALVNRRPTKPILQRPQRPYRPVVPIPPPILFPKFESNSQPPVMTSFPVRDVSPLESETASLRPSPHTEAKQPVPIFACIDEISTKAHEAEQVLKHSASLSSTSSTATKDDTSMYSKCSSSTSIDETHLAPPPALHWPRENKSASYCFSIVNPAAAGVFDELPAFTPTTTSYINKPLPPIPAGERRIGHSQRMAGRRHTNGGIHKRSRSLRASKSMPLGVRPQSSARLPRSSLTTIRHTQSKKTLDRFDAEFMRTSPYSGTESPSSSVLPSPTLSQAEEDLHEHLRVMSGGLKSKGVIDVDSNEVEVVGLGISNTTSPPTTDGICFSSEESKRESDDDSMLPPTPTIPAKSRKRSWRQLDGHVVGQLLFPLPPVHARRNSDPANLMTPVSMSDAPPSAFWAEPQLRRSVSSAALPKLLEFAHSLRDDAPPMPTRPPFLFDDGLCVVSGPVVLRPTCSVKSVRSHASAATGEAAGDVLVHILSSMSNLDDLFSTAVINKGMYRVYKENQMYLINTVIFNQSPPAWELREWCRHTSTAASPSGDAQPIIPDHSPLMFMRSYFQDLAVIDQLKEAILAQCQSFLRRDTMIALMDQRNPLSQRFTDAFWRIWSFCRIFGSQKGRDEDYSGQLDWLKGGRLANNHGCAATVSTNFDFDVSSILLNAPEHFGRANQGGLDGDQLYDIMEIWICMSTLLQGYLGRVEDAREFGIYDNCNVKRGDMAKEQSFLEEWIAYLLTLGPSVVLEMSEYALDPSSNGFALAKERGWTSWSPPAHTGSRATFLKEPLGRLYEEWVAATSGKLLSPVMQQQKESARKRMANHAAEIKLRRQESGFKRLPLIDMSMERPMSTTSAASNQAMPKTAPPPSTMQMVNTPRAIHPALRNTSRHIPVATVKSQKKETEAAEGQWPTLRMSTNRAALTAAQNRTAMRNFNGLAEDTAEMAITRITGMGFTLQQANEALRMTDGGNGLRVDKAVDLLLQA